jgi:hypothetical protein
MRRQFMASIVSALDAGTQRWAERTLGWNRVTIRKGQRELAGTQPCGDNFNLRGRKAVEHTFPDLRAHIKSIVEPNLEQDPTFRTTRLYRRVTAPMVHKSLLELQEYTEKTIPSVRTICGRLNKMGFFPRKVIKSKPMKKITQTDAIFETVHAINAEADHTPGALRLSMDTKAAIKVGPFSRGGEAAEVKRRRTTILRQPAY